MYAKVSGLGTAADSDDWAVDDLRPYIDNAIEQFGAGRLMFGSEWPPTLLAGGNARVWAATNQALASRPQDQIDASLGETARKVYRL